MKIYGWTIRWSRKINVKDDICTLYKYIVIFHRLITHNFVVSFSISKRCWCTIKDWTRGKKSLENNVSNKNNRSKKSISTYIQHTSWIHSSFKIFLSFHLFEFSSLSFFFCWFIYAFVFIIVDAFWTLSLETFCFYSVYTVINYVVGMKV